VARPLALHDATGCNGWVDESERRLDTEPSLDVEPVCQLCGRADTAGERLSWVMDRRAGTVSWTCPDCAATHIRALEAKLEPEWW
jgi:hypothetical protein